MNSDNRILPSDGCSRLVLFHSHKKQKNTTDTQKGTLVAFYIFLTVFAVAVALLALSPLVYTVVLLLTWLNMYLYQKRYAKKHPGGTQLTMSLRREITDFPLFQVYSVNGERTAWSPKKATIYLPTGQVTMRVSYYHFKPMLRHRPLFPRKLFVFLNCWYDYIRDYTVPAEKYIVRSTYITFEVENGVQYSLRVVPDNKVLEIICEKGEKVDILSFPIPIL